MNLNKENLKKIRGLIVFTVILLIALWNYSLILDVLGQGVGIVYPFLLGGAIAFVINVPMSFFEEKMSCHISCLCSHCDRDHTAGF